MKLIKMQDQVIHDVINEMYRTGDRLDIVKFILGKKYTPFNMDRMDEHERIIEIMKEKKLIETHERTGVTKLLPFGKEIAESDNGWLGHLGYEKEQAEKPEKDKKSERKEKRIWQGLFLLMATSTCILALLQYNQQDRKRASEELTDKQAGQLNQLKLDSAARHHLLEVKDKEILEIRQSLKASRDSLKAKEKN